MRRFTLAPASALTLALLAAPAGAALEPEPLSTFGTPGPGDGEFAVPTGVAIDHKRRIYVGDDDPNNRVQKFAPSTSFLAAFGNSGPGALDRPYGLDVDPRRRRVWVASSDDDKVVQFTLGGAFVREVSGIAIPYDVAVDRENGDVYVAELFGRIVRLSRSGQHRGEWDVEGDSSVLVRGIAIDPRQRRVYVTDSANDRVVVYTRGGNFVREWDTWSGGSVQSFVDPFGVAATRKRIYVADDLGGLVLEFGHGGAYKGETDGGSMPFSQPRFLGVNGKGTRLFVSDVTPRIYRFRI